MRDTRLDERLSRLESKVHRLSDGAAPDVAALPFRDDPVGFVREVLGGISARRRSNGAEYQFDVLRAIASSDNVVLTSGHGCGKSVIAAWAALWFLRSRRNALVLVLAPTQQRQARGIVQREVTLWASRARMRLRSDGIGLHYDETGSRLVLLTGAADVGALEGQHSDHVLLLCDEAKSLDRDVLDGVSGALTGSEGRTVLLSTPGRPVGPHFDATCDDTGHWQRFQIGSDDSDRVNPRWVAGRAKAWGENSPTFVMRVRGQYPQDGAGSLVSWALLRAACQPPGPDRVLPRENLLSLDVARSIAGDQSCAVIVRNGRVLDIELWREPSLTETARRALAIAARFGPARIVVDEGGVGAGLVDRLRELGQQVQGIHFGARAFDAERFQNARTECYWLLRERLEAGTLVLPADDELLEEIAAQRVEFDARGRIALAPKDEVRAALGRSPDRADAIAMACAPAEVQWGEPPAYVLTVGDVEFGNEAYWRSARGVAAELGLDVPTDTWGLPLGASTGDLG
jgi:phage terminase large subunit